VVYAYNPSTQKVRQEDFEFKDSLGNIETLSQKQNRMTAVVHTCNPTILVTQEVEMKKIAV
jgi:hypothetical protein